MIRRDTLLHSDTRNQNKPANTIPIQIQNSSLPFTFIHCLWQQYTNQWHKPNYARNENKIIDTSDTDSNNIISAKLVIVPRWKLMWWHWVRWCTWVVSECAIVSRQWMNVRAEILIDSLEWEPLHGSKDSNSDWSSVFGMCLKSKGMI